MPNHFHLMVYVNTVEQLLGATDGVTARKSGAHGSHPVSHSLSLNDSIGIMLRSYTRAVNNKEKRTGALFREETKAINLSKPEYISPAWFSSLGITRINIQNHKKQYPNICFNYINNNPVKDGLVQKPEDWEFSSFLDITGSRDGKLINRNRIKEYGLVLL
jgi:putative transposase